jgi:FtsH-binding integral membrane protein
MSIVFLSLVNFWFINIPLFSSLIALVFAVIFSVYLVIDTQLIIGKNKHNISLDNYVLGAIFLYLDIIGLFMEILRIVGKLRNN